MWQSLKRDDIDQARQQLELHRAETLRRQAEEIAGLEAEEHELATLVRLAEKFAGKQASLGRPHSPPPLSPPPLSPPPPPSEPIVTTVAFAHTVPRHRPAPRRPEKRDFPRTNFEAFARAVERTGP